MFKKTIKYSIAALALSLFMVTSASAMPVEQDPTEPGNNSYITSYWFSQNVFPSFIQYSSDLDFWNFVAPKTVINQDIWLIPPYGKSYTFAIYEYGSGTPIAHARAYGYPTVIHANLQQGKQYTVLVYSTDGSYDVDIPYYLLFPDLFPYN